MQQQICSCALLHALSARTGLELGTAAACCFQTLRSHTQHSETQCQEASHGRLLKSSQGGSLCYCPACPFFPVIFTLSPFIMTLSPFIITLFPFIITWFPFSITLFPFIITLFPRCLPVRALLTLMNMFSLLVLLAVGDHALLLAVPACFPCNCCLPSTPGLLLPSGSLCFWPLLCLSPLLLPFHSCYPFCLFLLISEEQTKHCDSSLPLGLS